ncbi:MAG: hypothetical protein JEY79_07280 [Pseudodesulfovibrio sp.]|nr:hypothetical protein [Pseudodesulfovibrio sp.]
MASEFVMTGLRKTLFHWGAGALLSTLFIWVVCIIFLNTYPRITRDSILGEIVPVPGSVQRWRSEGWGNTHYGQHGLLAEEESFALSDAPKVLLWGDSYVQSLQVSNDKKIASVFNSMSQGNPYYCLTLGQGGATVPYYYFVMPSYMKKLSGIKGHAILLSGMNDVLPYRGSNRLGRFLPAPWRLEDGTYRSWAGPNWKGALFGPIIEYLELTPFLNLYKKIKNYPFRLLPNMVNGATAKSQPTPASYDLDEGWRFLLSNLQQQSTGFFTFIYCPETPLIKQSIVEFEDREADLAEQFKRICKEKGISFIDMTDPFKAFYLKENKMTRGFINSPPGTGHFNEHGLRLIAQALHKHFAEVGK